MAFPDTEGPTMAKAERRVQRRPFIDASRAAELLGYDPRTVRKMVADGRLEGERVSSANAKRFEWRVFTDQPLIEQSSTPRQSVPAGSDADVRVQLAELLAQVAQERAEQAEKRARTAETQNGQIVAALHAMNEVLAEFQRGAELAQQSNAHLQAGSAAMSRVMGALLDSLAETSTPESPEGIEP